MSKTDDGGPAFPGAYWAYPKDGPSEGVPVACSGMSLRDYFAGKAMEAMWGEGITPSAIAGLAYQMADQMIYERKYGSDE